MDLDIRIVCGGKAGIMEAVCKGAKTSEKYSEGRLIGIIPESEKNAANPFCDIVIATGIGHARNQIIIKSADILIAIAGGAGTLSEIAFAWQNQKKVICYTGFKGWSNKLAGQKLDNRSDELLLPASDMDDIQRLVKEFLAD